ncbi:hypothetical protein PPTG_22057 [Phytophthora nicotianae INRA-310]|uniref:Uncharacterized protein n=1 Tax=Phytophthora nicotianae (strain INRA-310) TaxID=761204 RepID=W2QPK3_PHYN3|nr:hypothetical protein PPTG_22057 [Phytophthora nicotianae INRA-310]ETN15043.1 hypothetical protein PPTG_22057 [Phytophthora nicotianae INRA-310]
MTLIPDFSFDPGEDCGEEDMAVQDSEDYYRDGLDTRGRHNQWIFAEL